MHKNNKKNIFYKNKGIRGVKIQRVCEQSQDGTNTGG